MPRKSCQEFFIFIFIELKKKFHLSRKLKSCGSWVYKNYYSKIKTIKWEMLLACPMSNLWFKKIFFKVSCRNASFRKIYDFEKASYSSCFMISLSHFLPLLIKFAKFLFSVSWSEKSENLSVPLRAWMKSLKWIRFTNFSGFLSVINLKLVYFSCFLTFHLSFLLVLTT